MSATAPLTAPRRRQPSYVGVGRILELVFGGLGLLAALAFIAAGGALASAVETQRDADGYFTSATHRFETSSYALVGDLTIGTQWPDRALGYDFDRVRIRARSTNAETEFFIGIARAEDVDRYLARVEHDKIDEYDANPFVVTYERVAGDSPGAPPIAQRFWQAQASGTGLLTIVWPIEDGAWSVVAMNADGSRAIGVEAELAARASSLWQLVVGLFVLGGLSLVGGGALVYFGARARASDAKEG